MSDKQGDWNANSVQSAGGGFLVVGHDHFFHVSGRTGRPGNNKAGTSSTGLATLRRDGFASMDADEHGGSLTTRPVRISGRHLFVNVDNPRGELAVEILDQTGQVVMSFTTENCIPVRTNKTLQPVRWRGAADLSSHTDQPVRFRFHLKNGRLYAFWVSPELSGASRGYVAAGRGGAPDGRERTRVELQGVADVSETQTMGQWGIAQAHHMTPRSDGAGLLVHLGVAGQLRHQVGRNVLVELVKDGQLVGG